MGKAFDQIMEGLDDVSRYMSGDIEGFAVHVPEEVDVKAIRTNLKMSQPKFAQVLNVSVGRVRDWEQYRSPVDAPARAFLTVLEFEPEAVRRAMAKARERHVGKVGVSLGKAAKARGTPPGNAAGKTVNAKVRKQPVAR